MRLGSLDLGRVLLAPMAGITDYPFRKICKEQGADAVYTEMISSEALTRHVARSLELARPFPDDHPIGVQIFGQDIGRMAEAAKIAEDLSADFIDINMACPAPKVVARGAGAALMKDPKKARAIAAAVVKATNLPVTVKMRLGWDWNDLSGLNLASMLEEVGVKAIAVHARTCLQGFKEKACWERVGEIKAKVSVPVIISGDIMQPQDAKVALEVTGCDAVMVARGARGRPWIFKAIASCLEGKQWQPVSQQEMIKLSITHLDLNIAIYGEGLGVVKFRKHLLWYTKGLPGVVALRPCIAKASTRSDVVRIAETVFGDGKAIG